MHYAEIKDFDVANGEGVRVSLFVSGCTLHCPGCINEVAWDFCAGKPFDAATEDRILAMLEPGYISGLSVLGGEPVEPSNQEALVPFLRRVRDAYPQKSIWMYTGRLYDVDLQPGGSVYTEHTDALLDLVDVLVDGPFVAAQKDPSLAFRGSTNQRVIDLKETRRTGVVALYNLTSRQL